MKIYHLYIEDHTMRLFDGDRLVFSLGKLAAREPKWDKMVYTRKIAIFLGRRHKYYKSRAANHMLDVLAGYKLIQISRKRRDDWYRIAEYRVKTQENWLKYDKPT
jgi:hypothetical protein